VFSVSIHLAFGNVRTEIAELKDKVTNLQCVHTDQVIFYWKEQIDSMDSRYKSLSTQYEELKKQISQKKGRR
jgi:hypothetical protein